ncbi:hypothetical protein SAMN04489860_0618 [Paraoerskovia marina]|uniref:Lipoprotein n=1 Tax=Paraoerskovia marina TaxID=545619 RepID=A0A1H1NTQ0_9CELL|nr:hypothetical protein [Paraoerskovia marina]SDS02361.1 hypothetical protein SAMN04489860_0618 [Paraoerskovia marina]
MGRLNIRGLMIAGSVVVVLAACSEDPGTRPNTTTPSLVLTSGVVPPPADHDEFFDKVRDLEFERAVSWNARDFSRPELQKAMPSSFVEPLSVTAARLEPVVVPGPAALRLISFVETSDDRIQLEVCRSLPGEPASEPGPHVFVYIIVQTDSGDWEISSYGTYPGPLVTCDIEDAPRYRFDPAPEPNTHPVIGPDGEHVEWPGQ